LDTYHLSVAADQMQSQNLFDSWTVATAITGIGRRRESGEDKRELGNSSVV